MSVNELCMKLYGSVGLVVEEHEAAMYNARSTIKRLRGEISSLDANRDEIIFAHDRVRDQANSWERECKGLEEEVAGKREIIASFIDEVAKYKVAKDKLDVLVVALEAECNRLRTVEKDLRSNMKQDEEHIGKLEAESMLTTHRFNKANNDLGAECNRLRAIEKSLKAKVKYRDGLVKRIKERLTPHLLADYGAFVDYNLDDMAHGWIPISFEEFKGSEERRNLNYMSHTGHGSD